MQNDLELPSKIKSIYLELPEYRFQHGLSSDFSFFIGREKVRNRLKSVLLNAEKGTGGAYLVTGYRGMGKTSLVEQVIAEINQHKTKSGYELFVKIHISLSQDDIRDLDVMKFFATQLYDAWRILRSKIDKLNDYSNNRVNEIENRLLNLTNQLNAVVKKSKSYTSVKPKVKSSNLLNAALALQSLNSIQDYKHEIIRTESLPKEIEKELISILNILNELRYESNMQELPQFVFIIDELDKIEPSHLYDIERNSKESPSQADLDNIFGINKVRRRQEVIVRILANLKSFLNTAKAKFIFIGGREMYDASLADIADRDAFYSSIFHDVIYVNSFFKDQLSSARSGLTRMTEAFLCKILLPKSYVENYTLKHGHMYKDAEKNLETVYNLTTYYHYVLDLFNGKSNFGTETRKDLESLKTNNPSFNIQLIYKIIFFLQNLIVFLTYRSNGTPKKLVALLESYVINMHASKICKISAGATNIIATREITKKDGQEHLFLRFSFTQQYEVGLTTNIYRPYIMIHSRYLKSLGDKLLYSTAYIMDYVLKFHPHAFSWRNIEVIPEIILVNKDPNLRYFISDIVKFLSGMYIRETGNGLFMYKFYKKQSSEIQLLTKVSESSSAAFNFTLDETLHIIRYYRRKLEQLKSAHPNFNNEYIHSIGFVQGILADLYYFEREYDEAIIYYTDSVQVLRRMAQQEPHNMTKHQSVLYVRGKLLLGLCLEKIKAYDSAYSIYRGLILNIPRLLDKVISASPDPNPMILSIQSDEEWDKPIRRMQLFLKPHIALLDLIEKQRVDGITYANLSRNFKEVFDFLVDSSQIKTPDIAIGKGVVSRKKMDNMRVSLLISDYYACVGSLLFFKNRNFPELYTLLIYLNLTNQSTSTYNDFLKTREGGKGFMPSLSSLTYYYLALNELIESYSSKIQGISNSHKTNDEPLNNENQFVYRESDNAFVKTSYLLYPECIGIVNNIILFNFGNLLTRLGDALLDCLSGRSLDKYPLNITTVELFAKDSYNETQIESIYILDAISKVIHHGNSKDKRCQLSFSCDINFALAIYRLSGLFYLKAGRTYSYAFQYKKFLFVLKDYLLHTNTHSLKDNFKIQDPLAFYKKISNYCENIAERLFNSATWLSDIANRPQILKYREIFKYKNKIFDQEETRAIYLNLSTSAEIRETIVLVEEIKLKLVHLLNLSPTKTGILKTHVTPYDLITSRFSRVLELRYQSEANYYLLKKYKLDIILKSSILSDLQEVNALTPSNLEEIRDEIKRSGDKFNIRAILKGVEPKFKNKLNNLQHQITQRYNNTFSKNISNVSLIDIEKTFPELFINSSNMDLIQKTQSDDIKQVICDSIFALFEVTRTLNLYGINYICSYSFLANIHFKLANWCQIAETCDVIARYIDSINEYNSQHDNKPTLRETLRQSLGEEDIHYLEPNYHNELAIQHYHSAIQAHNGGNAYKSLNQGMSFLEDDFNDNLTHFSAASERFRINIGLVSQKIDNLKQKIKYSNVYNYDNYLSGLTPE